MKILGNQNYDYFWFNKKLQQPQTLQDWNTQIISQHLLK